MKALYPETFDSISAWAAERHLKPGEARERFAQGVILRAIATSRNLSRILVFKGGNALDFVWQPNRSTQDLDFSSLDQDLGEEQLRSQLEQALKVVGRVVGVAFRINSMSRQPPGPDKTFVTYEVKVGYGLPNDRRNQELIEKGQPSRAVVPIEVSLNEPVCDTASIEFSNAPNPLRVSTLEDIVAEKLRALLQQVTRNRHRRQDLLDIAVLLRERPSIDPIRIAEYLKRKAAARSVLVSKAAFHNPEVAARARRDYDALKETARELFIPFEDALRALLSFVDGLDIPESAP